MTDKNKPKVEKEPIPWNEVRYEYEAGVAVSSLAKKYDIKRNTLYSRIRRDNWLRSLVDQVKKRTAEIMAVAGEATTIEDAQKLKDLTETEANVAVEAKAVANVVVVSQHKKSIKKWSDSVNEFADIIKKQLTNGEITIEDSKGVAQKIDIPADYVGKAIVAGTKALQTLVQLERQAHGLDIKQGGDEAVAIEIFDADAA